MHRPWPVLLLAACALATPMLLADGSKVGQAAPHFALKSLDGKTISTEQLRGNIAVIHFAASW